MRHCVPWLPRLALLAGLIGLPASAIAWDYTPAAISGLTSLYGYLTNQNATLERAAAKYPSLRNDIQQVRNAFDRQYPDALETVTRLFQDIPLPATDRARLATKVLEMDREAMQSALASEPAMQAYLRRVRESAQGDMEKASLQLLLAAVYEDKPAAELASPMARSYTTKGVRQAGSIDLMLRMPLSWERDPARERLLPDNAIFAFTSQGGNGLSTIDLLARPLPKDGAKDGARETGKDAASAATAARASEELKALTGAGARVIAQGTVRLANHRANWASFSIASDGGRLQYGRAWWVPLPEAGQTAVLLCRTPSLPPQAADNERQRLEPLWQAVAATLSTATPAR
ncbi:hypothetical protein CR3_0213 [Cupriavidus gilardii CR3]|uniref:Tle cognate immunity protein 4 C-terminal domain-containing protein n=1 Tax=Cupriavidus gilardii TaxID=82541 RepID=A0A849BE63_9BURK|nr:hypothetical protein [Cupriavidus gilardii]ALD89471.1 hypothetical protein CR3_0213 [Cupriavidus gilardii CR3]KAB0593937.1 hypothetical protein F7Q96_24040 [Cupriavidus gilardii]MCT9013564.1 hypothetical protein [Cupriavidus gilardii]MCT9051751.1 hypothetical protein [Cupriavidus gilardii]NNH14210.1 hypothetical protein [Cupriavidus gilardii]